jgi:hypothetical protein
MVNDQISTPRIAILFSETRSYQVSFRFGAYNRETNQIW